MSLSASLSKSFGKMPHFRRTLCIPYFHSLAFHGPVNSDSRFKHLQGRKVRESTANQHPNPEFPGEKVLTVSGRPDYVAVASHSRCGGVEFCIGAGIGISRRSSSKRTNDHRSADGQSRLQSMPLVHKGGPPPSESRKRVIFWPSRKTTQTTGTLRTWVHSPVEWR
jgi:hypothetical protein